MASKYKRFIKSFYAFKFFSEFAFIYAVYIILFKNKGLNVFEISTILALWSVFVAILEVPTGALADKYNRKLMLILGLISKAFAFMIWMFADSLIMFALGFLFWSIQETFTSGTMESMLFDNLKKFRKQKDYEKIAGRGNLCSKIAIGTSMFIGGFIASYSFDLTIILTSLFMLVGIIPVLFFHDVKSKTSTKEVKYFHLIKNAFKEAVKNKFLLRLILYTIIVTSIIGSLEEYDQLYFNWLTIPISFFGVLAVSSMVAQSIGSGFAYKFKKRFNNENNIYFLSMLSGISLILAISYNSILLLPFYIFVFFFFSISEVLVESRLQRQIRTDQRATIISINSLAENLSAIFLTLMFGTLSETIDLTWGFLSFGLILIIFSVGSILSKKLNR